MKNIFNAPQAATAMPRTLAEIIILITLSNIVKRRFSKIADCETSKTVAPFTKNRN